MRQCVLCYHVKKSHQQQNHKRSGWYCSNFSETRTEPWIIIIVIIITTGTTTLLIIIRDSVNSTCKLIHMSFSSDRNIALKEIEKKSKYKDLELEIRRMWQMKTVFIPVVVGTVKKKMVENIKKVSETATVTEIQKICMLGSAPIHRKVLSVWKEWLTWVTDAPGARFAPGWRTKRTAVKTVIEETTIIIIIIAII